MTLFGALEDFAAGRSSLDQLYNGFYWPYFDGIDAFDLPEKDADLLDQVAEQMDLTDDHPDSGRRSDGWQSTAELRSWLSGRLAAHQQF